MSDYFEWNNFENIYLEDSYVLGIDESQDSIVFSIEAVLCENHPLYSEPLKNEQYCYRNGKIIFTGLKSVTWIEKTFRPSTDATGEIDYGNIDAFKLTPNGYYLEGSWGEVVIDSDPPTIELS
jgi:hypothetical protein